MLTFTSNREFTCDELHSFVSRAQPSFKLRVFHGFEDFFEARAGLVAGTDEVVTFYQWLGPDLGWRSFLQLAPGEVVQVELSVAGGAIYAMQLEMFLKTRQAEEALQGRIFHLGHVGEAHVVCDK